MNHCDPHQLGVLAATCHWFRRSGVAEASARRRVAGIARARGASPRRPAEPPSRGAPHTARHGHRGAPPETWARLLRFFQAQSDAAAQATSLSLGAHHSAGLLVDEARRYRLPRAGLSGPFPVSPPPPPSVLSPPPSPSSPLPPPIPPMLPT